VVSAKATKYVGVSSCLAALSMPLGVLGGAWAVTRDERFGQNAWPYLVVATCLAALVIYKHRGNIARTLNGTEARIGKRVKIEGR
jgi:glycerol-3-phosphate acyltransferase PlsY